MKVESAEVLGALLSRRAVFEVPIFQRKYSWGKPECKSLLEDIRAMVEKGCGARHFINALIYKNYSNSAVPSVVAHFTLIDGQQRLTTIMLILKNLELIAPQESDCYSEICAMLYEGGQNRPRLRLKSEDTEQFASILKASSEQDLAALSAQRKSSNLIDNFLLIREFMLEMSEKFNNAYERIYAAILKIYAVCICLEENDNAQEIFQSINSNGKLLSQADLIRNFILLGLSEAEQKRIYENYWKKLERESDAKNCKLDEFFRRYLRFRISTSVTVNQVYSAFADYAQELGDLDALLTDVMKFFDLYSLFYGADNELSGVSKQAKIHLRMFADLGFMTASSYIFAVYEAGHTPQDFDEILRLLLVDTIRKKFADPEKSRRFEIFYDSLRSSLKSAEKSQYVAALREQLKSQYSAKGKNLLSDKEFEKAVLAADFGSFNKSFTQTILCALENYQTAEQVAIKEEISIEHIMPQTPSPWGISASDPKFLTRLNSLGNLSLTAVNAQISNKPFNEKLTFYKDSKFSRLYKDVLSASSWDYAAIDARAKALAKRLVQLFSFEDPASPPQFRPFCAQEFASNKIKAARFCGQNLPEASYKGVYIGIMQALLAAQPARMKALAAAEFKSAKNAKKPAISTSSDGMNRPAKLAEEIFLETCYSAAGYARLIAAILKAFSKAENDLQLLYF